MKSIDVLLLSRQDILNLDLTPREVVQVVESALREHAAGTYEMHPKIGVHPTGTDPANFIHAMPAYLKLLGACGLKWVAGFARNYQRDLPNVTGVQVYNDTETGTPLAIMDCGYLTGLRTAAVSAIAAREGCREGAEVLALAGCGFEGTMHLRFITHEIPTICRVRLRDIREQAMTTLRKSAASYFPGEIEICPDTRSCLEGADVISTCTNGEEPLVRPEWFKPGAVAVGSKADAPLPPRLCTARTSLSSTTCHWPSISTRSVAIALPRTAAPILSFLAECRTSMAPLVNWLPARSGDARTPTSGSLPFLSAWPFVI